MHTSTARSLYHLFPQGTAVGLSIAAPFTLGATLVPAIVFGVLAMMGGLTSSGAVLTGMALEKLQLRKLQSRWEAFQGMHSQLGNMSCVSLMDLITVGSLLYFTQLYLFIDMYPVY